jgi:acid stress chaperone HdeB
MTRMPLMPALAASLAFAPAAQAQVQLDVAKITCLQYALYKVADPKTIAIWLDGYYQGKRENTVIDTQALIANADKLRDFCMRHPTESVLQASEKFLGPER